MKNLEIAKILNVSPATVSLALNDRPGVSPETKKKVLELKNGSGSSEPSGKDIGILVYKERADVIAETVFFTELINKLDQFIKEKGYRPKIILQHSETIEDYLSELNGLFLAGIVIIATEISSELAIRFRDELKTPFVMVDAYYDEPGIDCVLMDNRGGIMQAYECAKKYGFDRIGFVGSTDSCQNFSDRLAAFRLAEFMDKGTCSPNSVFMVRSSSEGAEEDFTRLLNNGADLPEMLLAANDRIAIGVMAALSKKGIRIPDDISIIGFDDMPLIQYLSPPLSSIKIWQNEIAWLAVRVVTRRIEDPKALPHDTKYLSGTELAIRESIRKK